jgi:hypothetical protein
MRWLWILLIASPASGDPLPTIDSAFVPTIRIAEHSMFPHPFAVSVERGEITWLTFEVVARGHGEDATYAIDLPTGSRVVGMSFDRAEGDGPVWSSTEDPQYAREHLGDDELAFAELVGSSADQDHVALHALVSGEVSLALELPELATIQVVANGVVQTAFAPSHAHSEAQAVAADTSLVVAPFVVPRFFASSWHMNGDLDKAIIRRHIGFHRDALRQCFMHVAQLTKRDNAAELEFMIMPDGTTADVAAEVEHDGAEIEQCLFDEIAAWQFPVVPDGIRTVVNYPLTFKLVR